MAGSLLSTTIWISDSAASLRKGVRDAASDLAQGAFGAAQDASGTAIAHGVIHPEKRASGKSFSGGFQIAAQLSKDALDLDRNVAVGVISLGGTGIEGVITAVTTTATDRVFDPVTNALKSIEGLESLGEGKDKINGLPTMALRNIREATKKAINFKRANGRARTDLLRRAG
ncbi:hypothetical protein K438DRAFT_2004065 [Mycena galopus ATCC 62051]|nr:hypothetical protein K438DRAFT_2004065 [Mycena galopus ATCC 62051]